jgi:hypothetical protein
LENLNFGEVITIYKLVQLCYFNFFLHVFFLQIEREDLHLEIVNLLQVAYEHIKVAINKNKSSSTEHCRNFCCGHFEKFNVSTSTDYTEFGRIARAFPQEVGSLYLQNKQKINSYDIFNNIIFNTEEKTLTVFAFGTSYIIPPHSSFYMSSFQDIGNLMKDITLYLRASY